MQSIRILALGLACSLGLFADKADVMKRLHESAEVINQIQSVPEKGIPQELLEDAHCIGVIPDMKKGGFIIGAKYGKGFLTCRTASGWSAPSAVKVEGGSFGALIGGGEVDLVLVVRNHEGAEKLMKSEFTLGGSAGVMAGPVGRSASAQTDALMHAQILSYSRSRGAFAGVSLDGSTFRSDDKDNEYLYGKPVTHKEILTGKVNGPSSDPLSAAIRTHAGMDAKTERARKTSK